MKHGGCQNHAGIGLSDVDTKHLYLRKMTDVAWETGVHMIRVGEEVPALD